MVGRADVGANVKGPVPLILKSIVSIFLPFPVFTCLIAHLSDPPLPSSRVFVTVKVESKTRSSSRCRCEMQGVRLFRSLESPDLCERAGKGEEVSSGSPTSLNAPNNNRRTV